MYSSLIRARLSHFSRFPVFSSLSRCCSFLSSAAAYRSSATSIHSPQPRSSLSLPLPLLRSFSTLTHAERKDRLKSAHLDRESFNPYNFKVAIFGRPNVGKSTIFNRLVGVREAIVHNSPGVTRDRREGSVQLSDLEFTIIDTAGLEEVNPTFLPQATEKSTEIPIGNKSDLPATQLILGKPLNEELQAGILAQTQIAVEECDIALFVLDGRSEITPQDQFFANWLRQRAVREVIAPDGTKSRRKIPIVLIVNKVEDDMDLNSPGIGVEFFERYPGLTECYSLGLGDPLAISAEHGSGLAAIHAALAPIFEELRPIKEEEKARKEKILEVQRIGNVEHIQLAIVGKPNVGKSTLVNAVIGKERVLTGPQPGITRDAIAVPVDEFWSHEERDHHFRVTLVDTAGLKGVSGLTHRKYSQVDSIAMTASLRAIDQAQVVALVVDVTDGLEAETLKPERKYSAEEKSQLSLQRVRNVLSSHDLQIAKRVIEEGRALLIVLNKWDKIPKIERESVLIGMRELVKSSIHEAPGVKLVPVSALRGSDFSLFKRSVMDVYRAWDTRINTGKLNTWLRALINYRPHPLVNGKPVKVKFLTQIKARPPTFALFSGRAKYISDEYIRFLVNSMREEFHLQGSVIKMHVKQSENPFVDGDKGRKSGKEKSNRESVQEQEDQVSQEEMQRMEEEARAMVGEDDGQLEEERAAQAEVSESEQLETEQTEEELQRMEQAEAELPPNVRRSTGSFTSAVEDNELDDEMKRAVENAQKALEAEDAPDPESMKEEAAEKKPKTKAKGKKASARAKSASSSSSSPASSGYSAPFGDLEASFAAAEEDGQDAEELEMYENETETATNSKLTRNSDATEQPNVRRSTASFTGSVEELSEEQEQRRKEEEKMLEIEDAAPKENEEWEETPSKPQKTNKKASKPARPVVLKMEVLRPRPSRNSPLSASQLQDRELRQLKRQNGEEQMETAEEEEDETGKRKRGNKPGTKRSNSRDWETSRALQQRKQNARRSEELNSDSRVNRDQRVQEKREKKREKEAAGRTKKKESDERKRKQDN